MYNVMHLKHAQNIFTLYTRFKCNIGGAQMSQQPWNQIKIFKVFIVWKYKELILLVKQIVLKTGKV